MIAISLFITTLYWHFDLHDTQLCNIKRRFISSNVGVLTIKETYTNNVVNGYYWRNYNYKTPHIFTSKSFQNWRIFLAGKFITEASFLRNYNTSSQRAIPINIDSKIEDVMGWDKVSSINDLFSFLQPTKNAELRMSSTISLFENSQILMDEKYSLQLPHHLQMPLANSAEDSQKKHEPLTVAYLQQEIGLSESVLMNVIIKYSWVMYLKVNTNLRCAASSLLLPYCHMI